jgi:peroxiredoxin
MQNIARILFLAVTLGLLSTAGVGFAQTEQIGAPEPLSAGDQAPNFRGPTPDGDYFHLYGALEESPVVLVFYRGHWCPFCNKHLKKLQDSLEMIQKNGAKVVAVTPEQPEYLKKMKSKTGAKFTLVTDNFHNTMDLYGVTYKLDDKTYKKYKNKLGVDINETAGNEDQVLPVPATYVIGRDKKIRAVQFDENYKNRSDVSWILKELQSL